MTAAASTGSARRATSGNPPPRPVARIAAASAIGEAGSFRIASAIAGSGCASAKPTRVIRSPATEMPTARSTTATGAHRRSSRRVGGSSASGSSSAPRIANAWKATPPRVYAVSHAGSSTTRTPP
jgi:hypothetical protein